MGESRRRTWSVKVEDSKCVKIYEHFFSLDATPETTPYKEVEESGNRSVIIKLFTLVTTHIS